MTLSDKWERRADRAEFTPIILEHLQANSAMRFRSRPSQLRAAAKQIARNVSAMMRRHQLKAA